MRYLWFLFLCVQFAYAQNDAVLDVGQQLIYENKHNEAITYFNAELLKTKNPALQAELYIGLAEVYKLQLN